MRICCISTCLPASSVLDLSAAHTRGFHRAKNNTLTSPATANRRSYRLRYTAFAAGRHAPLPRLSAVMVSATSTRVPRASTPGASPNDDFHSPSDFRAASAHVTGRSILRDIIRVSDDAYFVTEACITDFGDAAASRLLAAARRDYDAD